MKLHRLFRRLSLPLVLVTSFVLPVWSDDDVDPQSVVGGLSFRDEVELTVVNIDVFVTDKDGHAVSGLTVDDFRLLQDKQVKPITHFAPFSEDVISTLVRDQPGDPAPSASPAPVDPGARAGPPPGGEAGLHRALHRQREPPAGGPQPGPQPDPAIPRRDHVPPCPGHGGELPAVAQGDAGIHHRSEGGQRRAPHDSHDDRRPNRKGHQPQRDSPRVLEHPAVRPAARRVCSDAPRERHPLLRRIDFQRVGFSQSTRYGKSPGL
jgi:hypothetical protein